MLLSRWALILVSERLLVVRIAQQATTITHLLFLVLNRLVEDVMHIVWQVIQTIRVHNLWNVFNHDILYTFLTIVNLRNYLLLLGAVQDLEVSDGGQWIRVRHQVLLRVASPDHLDVYFAWLWAPKKFDSHRPWSLVQVWRAIKLLLLHLPIDVAKPFKELVRDAIVFESFS